MFGWLTRRLQQDRTPSASAKAAYLKRLGVSEDEILGARAAGSSQPGDDDYDPFYDGFFCMRTAEGTPNIIGYVDHDGSRKVMAGKPTDNE